MADYEVKDSGKREEFAGGSVRDTQDGKPRYELIPAGPLKRLAIHYANGAKKYGDFNWQKGQDIRRTLASMLRHSQCVLAGDENEDHLAAVAWNAFAIMWTREQVKAGLLPESLENVFTDAQFFEFYGHLRGTEACAIPCVECAHENAECPYIPPVSGDRNPKCAGCQVLGCDGMGAETCTKGESSVIAILQTMYRKDVIDTSTFDSAVADVRHCYSSESIHTFDGKLTSLAGWVTWSDTTQGNEFWGNLHTLYEKIRGGQ